MSIKMLIPVKIKLRGEERGGAFRSIIYDKLKKLRISKKKKTRSKHTDTPADTFQNNQ